MSQKNENVTPNETTASPEEEVLVGEIVNDTPTFASKALDFVKKKKTWLVAGGAAVGGFILAGFLNPGDECSMLDEDDYDPSEDDESYDSETE